MQLLYVRTLSTKEGSHLLKKQNKGPGLTFGLHFRHLPLKLISIGVTFHFQTKLLHFLSSLLIVHDEIVLSNNYEFFYGLSHYYPNVITD